MSAAGRGSAGSGPGLSVEVARLFFDRQMSKVEIGSRLGISRFRVARLIDQALDDGTVRVEFRDIPVVDRELARTIEERFSVDLCVVASDDGGEAARVGRVARLAASVIDGLIAAGDVVGIAWGSTMAAVAGAISPRSDPSLTVVQLAGSSTRLDADRDAGEVSRALAARLGATHLPLFAPTFIASAAVRDALVGEPGLARTVEAFARLRVAIVGIGAIAASGGSSRSSLVSSGVLDAAEIAELAGRGAVGDLVVHPFDAGGAFLAPELAARAIAIDAATLRAVPCVVAVAAGAGKAEAIRGALATGIVRILVTDALAAAEIVRDDRPATTRRPGRAAARSSMRAAR